jgi:hypothetical protein
MRVPCRAVAMHADGQQAGSSSASSSTSGTTSTSLLHPITA